MPTERNVINNMRFTSPGNNCGHSPWTFLRIFDHNHRKLRKISVTRDKIEERSHGTCEYVHSDINMPTQRNFNKQHETHITREQLSATLLDFAPHLIKKDECDESKSRGGATLKHMSIFAF